MENRDLVSTAIVRSDKWLRNRLGRQNRDLVFAVIEINNRLRDHLCCPGDIVISP
ncbi:hypothetical protein TIFTF001_024210 [Ficus carica]|uniref:Uncharacterized protein n=1 Tax=Ficus carica TaxID=3494 RepID=A0AA88DD59_FICCA|nr:hypothetical protein TIFTF001_024210 [Ficus carica]